MTRPLRAAIASAVHDPVHICPALPIFDRALTARVLTGMTTGVGSLYDRDLHTQPPAAGAPCASVCR